MKTKLPLSFLLLASLAGIAFPQNIVVTPKIGLLHQFVR
jgi:hypothetical protein